MNFIEAVRSGKPFRRPSWVKSDDECQWCIVDAVVFESCNILWNDGSTFGDITFDILLQDDFEIEE